MSIKTVKIKAYQYEDLCRDSQIEVMYWLDECPMEFENEKGSIYYEYFSELTDLEISDHCDANDYLFDQYGKAIHHLIITEK